MPPAANKKNMSKALHCGFCKRLPANLDEGLELGLALQTLHKIFGLLALRALSHFAKDGGGGGINLAVSVHQTLIEDTLQAVVFIHKLLLRLGNFAKAHGDCREEKKTAGSIRLMVRENLKGNTDSSL